MFDNEHPARRAALLSREYVHTKNREGWLSLYAEEGIIEDPIGVSMIDPEGKGHRGPAAREAFWDNFIAPSVIEIDIKDSYAAGDELANLVVLTTTIDAGNGKALQQKVFAVVTYHVNPEGKLLSLRGFWDTEDPRNTLIEIDSSAA
jgi:steroid delta-isomerase